MSPEERIVHGPSHWVVVANESAAEFYRRDAGSHSLTKEFDMLSDVARKKTGELISDSAGRGFDSVGQGRHAFSKEISPKESAVLRFANAVTDRVEKMSNQGRVMDYVLVCAPRFLGHLRKALERTSIGDPISSVDKDVVGFNVVDIEQIVLSEKLRLSRLR